MTATDEPVPDFEAADPTSEPDLVNHPPHYTDGPPCPACGATIECITITERMDFNLGNAVKYLWRSDKKGKQIEDLKKSAWYINREIDRLERSQ